MDVEEVGHKSPWEARQVRGRGREDEEEENDAALQATNEENYDSLILSSVSNIQVKESIDNADQIDKPNIVEVTQRDRKGLEG